jgi:hypothetical protein
MEFKNIAELYDFIENEARKRAKRILNDLGKGVPNA